jgi:hypothetical protein
VATRNTSDTTAEVRSAPTILRRCVGGVAMPRKPQPPASKGVVWNPDIYDIAVFVRGLNSVKAKLDSPIVSPVVMARLAGLARVTDEQIFRAGISFTVETARKEGLLLSSPVYRGELVERVENLERTASRLRDEIQAIENPADRTALWAGQAISAELNAKFIETGEWQTKKEADRLNPLTSYLRELSDLMDAIGKAKTSPSSPYFFFAPETGPPVGAGGSGMTLTRLVGHLAFAALAAGGDWTLNKNEQKGTLIEALEAFTRVAAGPSPSDAQQTSSQHVSNNSY